MNTCDICGKSFKRKDNMLRHKRSVHYQEELDDSETDISSSEDSGASESDHQEANDKYDPWDSLIQKTFEQCQLAFEEKVHYLTGKRHLDQEGARDRAYKELQPMFRKTLLAFLTSRVTWFRAIQADPIYKAIRRTAKSLTEMEDYDGEEAWKYAISKRKYLLDTVLEDFDPPKMGKEILLEAEDDVPAAKRLKL